LKCASSPPAGFDHPMSALDRDAGEPAFAIVPA